MKMMHSIFGVSALVMLLSTIWMFAADHTREWKDYQRTQSAIEASYVGWRIDEELTADHAAELAQWQTRLAEARSAMIDQKAVEDFEHEVNRDVQMRKEAEDPDVKLFDFSEFNQFYTQLQPLVDEAEEKRAEASAALAQAHEAAREAEAEGSDDAARERAETAIEAARQAEEEKNEAQQNVADFRDRLLAILRKATSAARLREDKLLSNRKFQSGNYDAALSLHGIAIGKGDPIERIEALQKKVDAYQDLVVDYQARYDDAKEHRLELEKLVKQITREEDEAKKQLDQAETDVRRLHTSLEEHSSGIGKWILRMPVLDAFYTGTDLQIDQLWLPDLTINYNFSDVARFDRCITCHRVIDKTAPGSAVKPAYLPEQPPLNIRLTTPESRPPERGPSDGEPEGSSSEDRMLDDTYGMQLAAEGVLQENDVTIAFVRAKSPAATAGLEMGDVIESIAGDPLLNRGDALTRLLVSPRWGTPLELTIRRGLPHPYATHPRLDLFGGSRSPHKFGEIGCTVCHDGQGSATAFQWASHTPNDPEQAEAWRREHGWSDNHHWIFPMYPKRFVESACLKCHHDVFALQPSDRFPDPPAPKLSQGYRLVRDNGCFGCHEINGFAGPGKRIGPDLRTEPNFFAVAHSLLAEQALTPEERGWAERLVSHPEDDAVRRRLWEVIVADKEVAASRNRDQEPRFGQKTHKLGDLLKDIETPGRLRRVGPSLRHLASKLDYEFLYSWIREPSDFRPTTRMPEFFGQWYHLPINENAVKAAATILDDSKLSASPMRGEIESLAEVVAAGGASLEVRQRLREIIRSDAAAEEPLLSSETRSAAETLVDNAEHYEPIEIRGMIAYLLGASMPFEYLPRPAEVTEAPSAERGKKLFETRGCLACHSEAKFPGIQSTQGPDLSRIAAKLNTEKGARWLYSWLRAPSRYHIRTKMPDLYLEPIREAGGGVTDPAADIAAYLLTTANDGWQPEGVPPRELDEVEQKALYDLALEYLSKQYPRRVAEGYLRDGIPERLARSLKGPEIVLVGPATDPEAMVQRQLQYVGRQSLNRYGCFGCHDIPGYEAAKPIGTALADWGRKEPSKLAFEQIATYLELGGHGHASEEGHESGHGGEGHQPGHEHGLTKQDRENPDVAYFLDAIGSHNRQGFLWQKLRQPRSYDFKKTENKAYSDRLRMPLFRFTPEEREAVMTFVLGLVSEPPATKYVFHPGPRQMAIIEGREVLEKYNCGGCHTIDMARWEFAFDPDDERFEGPSEPPSYPFLAAHFIPQQIEASLKPDRRGLMHAVLYGRPQVSETTGKPLLFDEEEDEIEEGDEEEAAELWYRFELWDTALIHGEPRHVGSPPMLVPDVGTKKHPAWGGDLANYLFPKVIADEKQLNPQVKGGEAWGWLPPPLVGQGTKVQTDWMHDFLLAPYPIRPAVVLRMPKFNLSSGEATTIANFFAARDHAEYPYEYDALTSPNRLAELDAAHPERLRQALNVVIDRQYCVQCHIVGDFVPAGSVKAMGPNLDQVGRRLRPEFLRNWIAKPQRILPYTGMPINIPFKPDPPHYGGVSQSLIPGTSVQQLDGLVDFLLNYDHFAKRQVSIKPLVKAAGPAAGAPATGAAGN